ncbi:MAG: helix-turn-helix transcriptional regulator [Deltaproteobacteria bacterium]|nr:helix-turn-helix transcriptional regulator [Deltaproteobacteria bacterium]
MMTVREVAAYLNIKERKVYDLVRQGQIPCSRVAGKWLFPQPMIDLWVTQGVGIKPLAAPNPPAPPVVAGSHDPLLEWALRESGCGLALMAGGSLDGVQRLVKGEAQVCGLHVLDAESGEYNLPVVRKSLEGLEVVLLEWAWRNQGLLTAKGNPLHLRSMTDLRDQHPRMVRREPAAGTHLLLERLLAQAGLSDSDLNGMPLAARSQTEVGLAILEGRADVGLGVEAVARQLQLDFIPLHRERYDLVMRRRDFFTPPVQSLMAFARSQGFLKRGEELGYDTRELGKVHYNAP